MEARRLKTQVTMNHLIEEEDEKKEEDENDSDGSWGVVQQRFAEDKARKE